MADNKSGADSSSSDGEYQPRQVQIPDAVDHFLGSLNTALQQRQVQEIHRLYEDTYNNLSKKHYSNGKWPSVQAVSEQVSDEPLFLVYYKELYYRHVYARGGNTVPFLDRAGSWDNYCSLLDLILDDLNEGKELSVALPPQWIYDILDEFVYDYQTYCNYRAKTVKNARDKELSSIRENPQVYETKKVLKYLTQLISASKIEEYLSNPQNPKGITGLSAYTDETVRYVGYFALMQLLRMHSLLGDFHLALATIQKIDLEAEVPLFYSITACHVTLYYYMGFAYLMLRRYADATNAFSDILAYLSKTAGVNSLSYQYEAIIKKQDQMFALLLLALALCPRSLDEALERTMKEKYADKQLRLQRGEELCFEETFQYACPKFVTPAPPNYDNTENFNQNEAHLRQLHLFQQEVRQQQFLPKIGAYMKLYTAITTQKLAQLCEMDEEALRDQLMCVMHKTRQRVRHTGAPLDGETQSCSEVEFYLDGDMVHINAQREERPHSEVFLEHILKYQDLLKKMGKA